MTSLLKASDVSLRDIPKILPMLSLSEQEKLLAELSKLQELKDRKLAQTKFLSFVNQVWPTFISGRHHARMASLFERVASGELKRVIINMAPRHTKSEFASYLLPAWFLGKYPHKKVIQTSHTAELAVDFGRKVRNLVGSEVYGKIFPGVELQSDSKAAGRWNTNKGGTYFAIGVGGAVTGKGADLLIIDDPHSEQEAALAESNPEIYDKTYEWYTSGPRQRLQPGGAIVIVQTRWSKRDLTGRVLQAEAQRGGEGWEVIEFPAILPSGEPLWPEFWPLEELEALRDELPNSKWMAQYMQQPTSDSAAIVKREWWKIWEKDDPPTCEFILQSWDTAFEAHNRADYSACTTWGVFYQDNPATGRHDANIILLNAFRERLEFPDLKRRALEQHKEWQPDSIIIEKKASGAPLIYEMRAMGIPVQEFTPTRGNDKISRLNAVSDLFASGKVWAPATRWAEEVIDEVASFPAGDHDDYCFVKGTLITMGDMSQKPIEQVVVGDIVATPIGPCVVSAAGPTRKTHVIEITTSSTTLVGTAEHPVMSDAGWTPIDNLKCGSNIVLLSTKQESSWGSLQKAKLLWSQLCSTIENITDTQIAKTQRTVDILLGRVRGYIEMFGSITTEKPHKGAIYTTSMGIQLIIGLKTLVVSRSRHTMQNIKREGRHGVKLWSIYNIWHKYEKKPHSGTALRKALRGIGNMLKTPYEKLRHSARPAWFQPSANNAVRCTKQRTQNEACTAQVNVLAKQAETGVKPHQYNSPVLSAEQNTQKNLLWGGNSYALRNAKMRFGIESVNSVKHRDTPEVVYNLTVDTAHAYYANGVLVHNCDSVSLALRRFRTGGYIRAELDEEDEPREFRRHFKGYY